ncbi:hypothetical protein EG328_000779 [Venturia inaequalis]|uniref:2,4-dienoyl-CoA reductase [(3E)-enoyl-CoA-producing] n=1 Tax=Venturia inaequalis TaxID=5025 RepID=A0A8H3V221_VENIN|nr:hypothetical protein EG328_000779 [Venturia inaequalis]
MAPSDRYEYLSDVWKDGLFDNKVLFCTGGAGTICSAQVRAFVHLGGNACIIGRNVKKTETMALDIATARPGAKVLGIGAVDVREPKSLQDAADRAGAAGNFLAPIRGLSPNAFKTVMDIDVMGSYNTLKATLPYLIQSAQKHKVNGKTRPTSGTGGRIIFVSATMHYTGVPLQAHVVAAKAAVDALAHAVCIEQGPLGVTSNVIAPGPIAGTEGMERLSASQDAENAKHIPSGRWGYVKEISDATVYLFSDAGNYVNGEILVVDGGSWHMGMQPGKGDFQYPDFLLTDEEVKGVKSGRKAKL